MRDVGLQKYTKKSVLNVGFICVTGPQGVGKTSFVTALLRSDYKKANKQRYKTSLEFVRSLRSTGYYPSLKMPQHIYFSNTDIALRGSLRRPKAKCWFIDTQRLALPNDLFEVQYFPQGSVSQGSSSPPPGTTPGPPGARRTGDIRDSSPYTRR